MGIAGNTWAIVLAGGSGTRLRSLTTDENGLSIPKQFCSLGGDRSLLHVALERAAAVAAPEHILVVVTEQHRRWWRPALAGMARANIIVQPENRGTANGVLLPLLHVIKRDAGARVVLLPSDHHVDDESILASSLQQGIRELDGGCEQVMLLGITPSDADPDLGYIVPGPARTGALAPVRGFVEKPDADRARKLIGSGALWNTFIVIAQATRLLQIFAEKFPQSVANLSQAVAYDIDTPYEPDATAVVYQTLLSVDFSLDLLSGQESALGVLPVGRCGWSDLGTPQRLAKALQGLPIRMPAARDHAAGSATEGKRRKTGKPQKTGRSQKAGAIRAKGFLNLGQRYAQWMAAADAAGTAVPSPEPRQPAP
jgi:mannose-1-phosphate guanylyltransferase